MRNISPGYGRGEGGGLPLPRRKSHLSVMLPDNNVCFRSRAQSLPESQRNVSFLMLRRA